MSHENVEVVVKQFEDANANRFADVMDAWAEDVSLVLHGQLAPLSNTAAGKTAVGEWFADWFRQFGPGYRFEIEETRLSGDRVFLLATHHGHGRRSGAAVEQRTAYVYTVQRGKVTRVEVWSDEDREAALEAVGLRD
jgi:ketosteroid isomerase-like protein